MSQPRAYSPARITLTVIGLVLATVLTLALIYATSRVLVWMVIAAFFATALHPVVLWVERRARWCRRWLATLIVFLLVTTVLAGLTVLFVVPLVRQISQFADSVPGLIQDARSGRGPIGEPLERFHVLRYADENADQIKAYLSNLGTPTLAFLRGAATTVAGAITIFVLAYLMVLQAPRIIQHSVELFPDERSARISRLGSECARTITGYLGGNLLISIICGSLTFVVLRIFDVPYAGLIALWVAIMDMIPLIGATLGAIVAVSASFIGTSVTAGVVVLIYFIVYQQIENHLLQPVVFARTVRLSPLTVLVSIIIAVELAGIVGALLAIPVAGIVKVIARDVWEHHRPGLAHAGQVRPAAAQPGGRRAGDLQPGATRPGGRRAGDTQPGATQPDRQAGEVGPGPAQPSDVRPGQAEPSA